MFVFSVCQRLNAEGRVDASGINLFEEWSITYISLLPGFPDPIRGNPHSQYVSWATCRACELTNLLTTVIPSVFDRTLDRSMLTLVDPVLRCTCVQVNNRHRQTVQRHLKEGPPVKRRTNPTGDGRKTMEQPNQLWLTNGKNTRYSRPPSAQRQRLSRPSP